MRFTRSVALALFLAAVSAGAGVAAFQLRQSAAPGASAGAVEQFYQQTLRDAAGAAVPMANHRGKVVVVNFWATWCVPCVQEIPAFSKAHTAAAGRVAFVGLGIDSPENIAAFEARIRPSYPLDNAGAAGTDLARAFGNDAGALPFTVVIDGSGKVVASHLGKVDEATLTKWLQPYLREPASASSTAPAATPS